MTAEMFPFPGPRIFGLPAGVDFAREIILGLSERLAGQPPEAWGRVTIYVPTRRMQRRLRAAFDTGEARLLPRIRLVSDVALDPAGAGLPPPVPALRRRLELTQLVAALLEKEPDIGPRARIFDLSDSLASLMEEMQGAGVPPSAIAELDVTDLSGHWARALACAVTGEDRAAAEALVDALRGRPRRRRPHPAGGGQAGARVARQGAAGPGDRGGLNRLARSDCAAHGSRGAASTRSRGASRLRLRPS